jgi:hypothetical protein
MTLTNLAEPQADQAERMARLAIEAFCNKSRTKSPRKRQLTWMTHHSRERTNHSKASVRFFEKRKKKILHGATNFSGAVVDFSDSGPVGCCGKLNTNTASSLIL